MLSCGGSFGVRHDEIINIVHEYFHKNFKSLDQKMFDLSMKTCFFNVYKLCTMYPDNFTSGCQMFAKIKVLILWLSIEIILKFYHGFLINPRDMNFTTCTLYTNIEAKGYTFLLICVTHCIPRAT